MPDERQETGDENEIRQRLNQLLERLARHGISQQEVARRAGLPPQYLSDIKCGRRPMTELVARRLGEEFQYDHAWLLGTSGTAEIVPARLGAFGGGSGVWLPLFPHPVTGEPRALPIWDGACVEIPGVAAAQLALTKWPYVLRFGHDDIRGRLRRGDLILISQSQSTEAEINVVRHRRKLFLARPDESETWERIATGQSLPATCRAVGFCVGVVWSPLTRPKA